MPHAVAGDEVRIANYPVQDRKIYKIPVERNVSRERIRQSLAGSHALAGQCRINELRKDVHPGAGAADGNIACNQSIEGVLDRLDHVIIVDPHPAALIVVRNGNLQGCRKRGHRPP